MPFFVSCVIPAFNEAAHLPQLLRDLALLGRDRPSPAVEFVVSDDGSRAEHASAERTACDEAQRLLAEVGAGHRIHFVASARNRGKGAAIRLGWDLAAREAGWLAFLDADGAVSAGEFFRLAGTLERAAADVVAASRVKMAGRSIERSLVRHLQGRVFATLVEQMLQIGFYDSQCGLKFFRAAMLRPILPELREDRWLLDPEVLAMMKRAGARIVEEPVDWVDPGDSKVVPGVDAAKMFFGLRRIQRRVRRLG
jgi:dolichyl-phosphate beta-glucosyltransferase